MLLILKTMIFISKNRKQPTVRRSGDRVFVKHDYAPHLNVINSDCEYVLWFKLMKGKALRKHSLHEKTAASVLLKLFISGNE